MCFFPFSDKVLRATWALAAREARLHTAPSTHSRLSEITWAFLSRGCTRRAAFFSLSLRLGFLGRTAPATSLHPADVWEGAGVAGRREHHQNGRAAWLGATHRSRSSCRDGPRSLTDVSTSRAPPRDAVPRAGGQGSAAGSKVAG